MSDEGEPGVQQGRTSFAHASEAEFAHILDFYEVRWQYEPQVFPILWDLDGNVLESFAPDFYLPDMNLFVEMTTLQQRLVRKKNRKVRRLHELYPDISIKLFYARDFRALMLKYGRTALLGELTGSPGQVGGHPAGGVLAATDPPAPGSPPGLAPGDDQELAAVAKRRRSRSSRAARRRRAVNDSSTTPVT